MVYPEGLAHRSHLGDSHLEGQGSLGTEISGHGPLPSIFPPTFAFATYSEHCFFSPRQLRLEKISGIWENS